MSASDHKTLPNKTWFFACTQPSPAVSQAKHGDAQVHTWWGVNRFKSLVYLVKTQFTVMHQCELPRTPCSSPSRFWQTSNWQSESAPSTLISISESRLNPYHKGHIYSIIMSELHQKSSMKNIMLKPPVYVVRTMWVATGVLHCLVHDSMVQSMSSS